MERRHILGAETVIDVPSTRLASLATPAVVAAHCRECAVFSAAVQRSKTLAPLLEIVRAQGADPLRPDEVWGAADGDYLNGWWSVVGEMISAPSDEMVTLAPGLRVWVGPPIARAEPPFQGKPVITIGFEWVSPEVAEIGASLGLLKDPPAPT